MANPLNLPLRAVNSLARRRFFQSWKPKYHQDGLITQHSTAFMEQDRFTAAYAAAKEIGTWRGADIHWRAHVIAWAAELGSKLEGDFVECGVDYGGTAMVALTYSGIAQTGRHFYLLDTFEGLDDRFISEAERAHGLKPGTYPHGYERVKNSFAQYNDVTLIKGAVPETLSQVPSDKVAYLSIDMNCTEPEIATGEFFWPKLSPGAPIVLDDYGWSQHEEQRKAWDKFAEERGLTVLGLPTGQGLLIKPPA